MDLGHGGQAFNSQVKTLRSERCPLNKAARPARATGRAAFASYSPREAVFSGDMDAGTDNTVSDAFACFHPVTAEWFKAVFDAPTAPQRMGWPVIARGENALILAPTGTGKTLAAFCGAWIG